MVATISKPNNGLTTSRTKTPIQVSRKRKRLALIPADLKIRIDKLNIKPQSKESCLNLACYIYLACQKQADENNLWMPISQIHFEENVSTDYLKPLKKLKEAGIVECNEYYHYTEFKGEGQCKKYRIKPELLEAELVPVRYSNNKKNTYQNTPIVQQTLKNLEKLSIVIDGKTIKLESDLWKLKSIIENHINEDWFFRNCRINECKPSFCR